MKNKPKQKRKAETPSKALTPLPAKDAAIGRHREIETAEMAALREEICAEVTDIRREVRGIGDKMVVVLNKCRAVGELIQKALDALPGKQMTIDFWHQQQSLYVDKQGQPITLENLKWFVKVARAEPLAITDVVRANAYEKDLLALIGFNLQGEAPGQQPAAVNHWLTLRHHFDKWPTELEKNITALEKHPAFGPVETWDADRRKVLAEKLAPLESRIRELMQKLRVMDA